MKRLAEVRTKYDRVKKFLHEKQYGGVLLTSTANFAWLTGGGDTHVENHNKFGVATLFATPQKLYVITNNIEVERIKNEELQGVESEFEFAVSDWFDPAGEAKILKNLASGLNVATDMPRGGMSVVGSDFSSLRFELTEAEIEKYRWLGEHSSQAVEDVGKEIEPGMTEHEIEAAMARKLLSDNMMPVVLLVAVDERNFQYRHPIPTEKKLKNYVQLICCARRWGLITSRTRSVYFGNLPSDLKKKQEAAAYVDSVFMARTRPGVVVGKIVDDAIEAYKKVGYPDEWHFHHQGGSTGYESRDYIGISESKEVVLNHQGFTWNPTIQGTKSEDTIIVTSGEPEIITLTEDWPVINVEVDEMEFNRPAILER
jgi:Xaa-Pro aminopeptidase